MSPTAYDPNTHAATPNAAAPHPLHPAAPYVQNPAAAYPPNPTMPGPPPAAGAASYSPYPAAPYAAAPNPGAPYAASPPPSWVGQGPPASSSHPPAGHPSQPSTPPRARRGVLAIVLAVALLLAATGAVVTGKFGLGRLNPFAPSGGAAAGGTVHYRGMTITVDPPVTEKAPTGTFRVSAHATVVNDAKWTDDSKHTANLANTPPQLVIDGKRVGATVTMNDVPAGGTGPATFSFDNYQSEPDLGRATIEFGDSTTKIGRIGGADSTVTLAPVPVQLAGQLTTGPDTTTVTVVSSELRADVGDTEVPAGKVALRIRYRFTRGTNYTNGAAASWAFDSLELRAPDGTSYQPAEGTTAKSGDGEGTVVYLLPETATGTYTLTDTYVGCCGTSHGTLEFAIPGFGPTGTVAS